MSEKIHLRKRVGLLPAGLAGTGPNGSFFEAPSWVDQTKAPGTTSQVRSCLLPLFTIGDQEGQVAAPGYWIDKLTGKTFFLSPNLVWILIALTDYFLFPYDFQSAKSLENLDWVLCRQEFQSVEFKVSRAPYFKGIAFQVLDQFCHHLWLLWILALRPLPSWLV